MNFPIFGSIINIKNLKTNVLIDYQTKGIYIYNYYKTYPNIITKHKKINIIWKNNLKLIINKNDVKNINKNKNNHIICELNDNVKLQIYMYNTKYHKLNNINQYIVNNNGTGSEITNRTGNMYDWLFDMFPKSILSKYNLKSLQIYENSNNIFKIYKHENINDKSIGSRKKKRFILLIDGKQYFYMIINNISYDSTELSEIDYYIYKDFIIAKRLNELLLVRKNNIILCDGFSKIYKGSGGKSIGLIYELNKGNLYDYIISKVNEYNNNKINIIKLEQILKNIYFQLIYSLHCAYSWYFFQHCDFHCFNIMTNDIKKKVYQYNNKFYYINDIDLKIIDYDRSYVVHIIFIFIIINYYFYY